MLKVLKETVKKMSIKPLVKIYSKRIWKLAMVKYVKTQLYENGFVLFKKLFESRFQIIAFASLKCPSPSLQLVPWKRINKKVVLFLQKIFLKFST